jgi:phosphoribosyl-AMP cyclohydrolase
MSSADQPFAPPGSRAEVEEGDVFMPKFDAAGLITAVAVDAGSGEVLMVAHMNAQALARTLESGQAWYWSRSRGELWLKGETSGQIQTVVDIRVDCDQDCLLLRVTVGGDGGCCHTGRRACFYRRVEAAPGATARLLPVAD